MARNDEQDKALITSLATSYGFEVTDEGFKEDEDNSRLYLFIGRGTATEDHDEEMFFEGDEGEMWVTCVGSEKYSNLRPVFTFRADGIDTSGQLQDPGTIELE